MSARRVALPPPVVYLLKSSLDSQAHSEINSVLKQLKSCSRRLHAAFASHALELQVLERLYYKGKNQHRTALFWRNVAEIRRYGERVESMELYGLIERMRVSFWGEAALQNMKLLKGSWTHYPEVQTVMFVMRRCREACSLLEKARDRLSVAYHSFTLVMQTAAFLQLILTLVAIASRLSSLLTEIQSCMILAASACHRLLQTLDPKLVHGAGRLVPPASAQVIILEPTEVQANASPHTLDGTVFVDEDVGRVLVRRSAKPVPEQDITSPNDVSLLREDLNMVPTAIARPTIVTRENPISTTSDPIIQISSKRKNEIQTQKKAKKRKKRDEIDDIFGI